MNKVFPIFSFIILLFLAKSISAQTDSLQNKILKVEELKADFNFLRKILEETHPGLYRYTPKQQMHSRMDSIAGLLDKDMPFYDFYRILSALIADIRCAHTYILPKKAFQKFHTDEVKTFPFSVQVIGDQFFVVLNGTLDAHVKVGFELLAINGRKIDPIKQQIFRYLWADGYIQSSKTKTISEGYFPLFYYLYLEQPKEFVLTLKNLQGEIMEVKTPAQTWGETSKNFTKNPVNQKLLKIYQPKNKKDKHKPWRLEFLSEPKTALLKLRNFGGGNDEDQARKKMHDFMNDCMKKLHSKKTENLIIDLRYNGGGWDIQGVELFTFLANEPARYYNRLHAIADSSEFLRFSDLSPEDLKNIKKELKPEPDGTFSVKEEFSEQLKLQNPKPNRFKGKIYFLMNGGSASAAAEFLAVAKSNQLGVFIGEESGGAYEGGNGGSFLHFDLPHSKISFGTPLLYYDNAVSKPKEKGRGTLPDYFVANNIQDMIRGVDTQLNFTLKLIKEHNN